VRFHHFAQALIPLGGCGVFLGLSGLTVTMLKHEGFRLYWINDVRAAFLVGAALWSILLGWRIAGEYAGGLRRIAATANISLAAALGVASWALLFWIW
jgi:hypothetical protein